MQVACMDAATRGAAAFRPTTVRAGWVSRAAPAVLISLGVHAVALALWQPAPLSIPGGAAGDTGGTSRGGLVIDLAALPPASAAPSAAPLSPAPAPPPPTPETVRARPAPVAPPADTAVPVAPPDALPVDAAPALEPVAPEPAAPTVAAPRPAAKPAPPHRPARAMPAEPAPQKMPEPAAAASPAIHSHTAPGDSTGAASPSASPSLLPETRAGQNRHAAVPVVRSPRFLSRPAPPAYPARAVQLGLEGTAIVRALVGGAGTPQEVRLVRSSGFEMLDEAALDAVRTWQFAAAVGAPRAWVELPVRFRLH